MEFLNAFLIGGAICVVFQAILMITKIDLPKILIGGIGLGGLLSVFGVMSALMAFNTPGVQVMAFGAGGAVHDATVLVLTGAPQLALTVLGIFIVVILIGVVAGVIRVSTHKTDDN